MINPNSGGHRDRRMDAMRDNKRLSTKIWLMPKTHFCSYMVELIQSIVEIQFIKR